MNARSTSMVVTESDNACVGYIALSLARRMIDFVGRCGYGRRAAMDAFMSGAAEGEKGLPVGGKQRQSPSVVEIDIDKYWPFIPLLSQDHIMYGGNNNS